MTSTDLAPYNAAFPNRDTGSTTLMGCPMGVCRGYELMGDLNFNNATTSQQTWSPNYTYQSTLEGNGHTISNLSISVNTSAGLFPVLHASGTIRNLGLVNPTVTGRTQVGALAGANRGNIIASWVSGGTIASNAAADLGGIAGKNEGSIIAGYSTASVNAGAHNGDVGGLVGENEAVITASYAAGATAGTGAFVIIGGLAGRATSTSAITDSYCGAATGQANCIGNPASNTGRYTAADLQAPTGYTGIYANWNVDLDGDTFPDNPWYFGTSTSSPTITDPKTSEPPAANQRTIDHDPDDDNLINVDTLQKLNAIRHDLDGNGNPANIAAYAAAFPGGHLADTSTPYMGCAATCIGYELTANLDFAADGVAVTSTDPYPNWQPITVGSAGYSAVFEGNGHTIARLTLNRTGADAGLFGELERGTIRNVGILEANVRSGGNFGHGTLVGVNNGGAITASYAQGGSVTITAILGYAGGLVGRSVGPVRASYSTAAVNGGSHNGVDVGGLVGLLARDPGGANSIITASYAAGTTTYTGNGAVGGLAGRVRFTTSRVANSYCDTESTGQSNCIGAVDLGATATAAGHTTADMQTPTAYTGIYANWNVSVDGDAFPDNPWNFGTTTTYPTLKTPTQRQAAAVADYDSNNNNLIDVDSVYKLNAIRHDLNGDGLPDAAGNYPAYAGAFPDGDLASTSSLMGCAATCIGYELTGNINFAADGIAVTSTDAYPNWTPIGGSYAATFDGKGNTINHLTITGATGNSGLFDTLASGGIIRDVGIVDASIGNDGADAYVGVLAGDNDGGSIITSYASGGAVTITGTSTYGGG